MLLRRKLSTSAEVVIYTQSVVDPKKFADFLQKDDEPMIEIAGKVTPYTEPGMYSVLLLRKVVNGEVRDIPLVPSFIAQNDALPGEGPIPVVQRVYQFADLNGDGTMEIIFGGAYYEGYGYNVIEVQQDGSVEIVLSNGSGR